MLFGESFQADVRHINGDIARGIFPEGRGAGLLTKEIWWKEYFAPLEKLIGESQSMYPDDPTVREGLHQAQEELDMFNQNPDRNSSVYFVMKKK